MKIPDINPKVFSLSAVIVGYLLIDDMTAKEQNALGNWLMLVAQVLSTNAYYKEVQDERKIDKKEVINLLTKMEKALNEELNKLNRKS